MISYLLNIFINIDVFITVSHCNPGCNMTYIQSCPSGTDKWMSIPNMGYVIANQYNVIVVCISLKQSITIFFFKDPTLD